MIQVAILLCVVTCLVALADGAKIVAIPYPITSHMRCSHHVSQELQKLGHNVTLVLPEFILKTRKADFSDMNIIVYKWLDEKFQKEFEQFINSTVTNSNYGNFFGSVSTVRDMAARFLSDDDLWNQLSKEDFDFAVADGAEPFRFLSVFPYRLALPFAILGAGHDLWTQSSPFLPSFTPHISTRYTDKMTFFQRAYNTLVSGGYLVFMTFLRTKFNLQYGLPLATSVIAEADICIFEKEPVLDYPTPTMPHIKMVGGLSIRRAKPLPADLDSFMNNSKGVIYVSFGTIVNRNMLADKWDLFLEVFLSLSYNIVWATETQLNNDRIYAKPWLPQNDVLGHAKTKLFISHCGANSQYESIYHGVPILCIPFFCDQFFNGERSTAKGFGETIDFYDLNHSNLETAIYELLSNGNYTKSVSRASQILKSSGKLPSETAAYWIDHVIKYGGSYMRSGGRQLNWYQYLLIDVLSFYLFVVYMVYKILKFCASFAFPKNKDNTYAIGEPESIRSRRKKLQ